MTNGKIKPEMILPVLFRECDPLPPGAALPSIRIVKKRFRVGQNSASEVVKALASHYGVKAHPRTKLRKPRSAAYSEPVSTDTILLMPNDQSGFWAYAIGEFNKTHSFKIIPRCTTTFYEHLSCFASGKTDFSLLQDNPLRYGGYCGEYDFMDLRPLLHELDMSKYHPGGLVESMNGRALGIGFNRIAYVVCRNSGLCAAPDRDYSPDGFEELLISVKRKAPENMKWPFNVTHYAPFFNDRGVSFINRATLDFDPDKELFTEILQTLRRYYLAGLMPPASGFYIDREDLRLFSENRIAMKIFNMPLMPVCESLGYMPVPSSAHPKKMLGAEFFAIRNDSLRYRCAWEFIKFALSPKIQRASALVYRTIPAMRGITPHFFSHRQFALFETRLAQTESAPEDAYFSGRSDNLLETLTDKFIVYGGEPDKLLFELKQFHKTVVRQRFADSGGR